MNKFYVVSILTVCCSLATVRSYVPLGGSHSYTYNTSVLLGDASPQGTGSDVGYQLLARLDCSTVWSSSSGNQQLLLLQLKSPQLLMKSGHSATSNTPPSSSSSLHHHHSPSTSSWTRHQSLLDRLPVGGARLLVQLSHLSSSAAAPGGIVDRLWRPASQSEYVSQLVYGAANMLLSWRAGDAQTTELDLSGECDVTYSWYDVNTLLKHKTNCRNVSTANTSTHTQGQPLSMNVLSERSTRYYLSGSRGISVMHKHRGQLWLSGADSFERHLLYPVVRPQFGSQVAAWQHLRLLDSTQSQPTTHSLVAASASSISAAVHQMSLESPHDVWSEHTTAAGRALPHGCRMQATCTESLTRVALSLLPSPSSPSSSSSSLSPAEMDVAAFVALLPHARRASSAEIVAALDDPALRRYRPLLLDVAAAAATEEAHSAVRRLLDWGSSGSRDTDSEERYLAALAVVARPPRAILTDILAESRGDSASSKLQHSLLLTLAALAKSYCSINHHLDQQLCSTVSARLLSGLSSCTEVQCCTMHVHALANWPLPESAPALMTLAEANETECAEEAMRSLTLLPVSVLAPFRNRLSAVFFQTRQEHSLSLRVLAAEILLNCAEDSEAALSVLRYIVPEPYTPSSAANSVAAAGETISRRQLTTYLLKLASTLAERRPAVAAAVRRLMSDPRVANYDVLAPGGGGTSSVLHRQLYQHAGAVSASLASSVLMASRRALRHSQFAVQLDTPASTLQLLQFAIHAGGLSGLLGAADLGDTGRVQARLQLALLGRQLRPLQLFSSQAQLMGQLLAGSCSERTSAAQGTLVLHDHQDSMLLQNGVTARLAAVGSVAFDFAGQVQVSLWHRNAHALIDTRGALLLRTMVSADTELAAARVTGDLSAQLVIDSNIDVETHDGFRMCTRVMQAPATLRQVVRKQERVAGTKHKLRRTRRSRALLPGSTFNMVRKNSQNCDIMFGHARA